MFPSVEVHFFGALRRDRFEFLLHFNHRSTQSVQGRSARHRSTVRGEQRDGQRDAVPGSNPGGGTSAILTDERSESSESRMRTDRFEPDESQRRAERGDRLGEVHNPGGGIPLFTSSGSRQRREPLAAKTWSRRATRGEARKTSTASLPVAKRPARSLRSLAVKPRLAPLVAVCWRRSHSHRTVVRFKIAEQSRSLSRFKSSSSSITR